MRRMQYPYPLGVISCLEKKLASPRTFFEFLPYSLERFLSQVKPYFFTELYPSYQRIDEFEAFLKKEAHFLETLIKEFLPSGLFECFASFFKYEDVDYSQLENSSCLFNLFKLRIDFYNILFFLRASYLRKEFSPTFFGFLSKEELALLLGEDKVLKVKKPIYFEFLSLGRSFLEEKDYYLLDFLSLKFLRREAQELKKPNLGPERIFYFYFSKALQDKMMKVILSFKLYNLKEESLRKALELVYG